MAILDKVKTAVNKAAGTATAVAAAAGTARKGSGGISAADRYKLFQNGTEDELRAYLNTGKIPDSYTTRMAAAPQNYVFWNAGRSTIGDYGLDRSNEDTWRQISALYGSGDTNGAMELVNSLSDKGRFGGWYDDEGKYWGFAQGYEGGANGSYQPVLGGTLISKGLEPTGTSIWLTPDGKALHLGEGGALTDRGDTWSHTQKYDPALSSIRARETLAGGSRGGIPTPDAGVPNGNGGMTYTGGTYPGQSASGTIYEQALNEYTGGQQVPSGGQQVPSGGQQVPSGAGYGGPAAYDPESDTLWQQYLNEWQNARAPEYGGDPYREERDAALRRAQEMEWNYDPNTDPVWQALQKQYRREGQRATEDTLGRYAAMTGGRPSTAAVTAASQAGDYYAAQLSDRLPQVYQDAYNRYLQEYQRQLGISDQYDQFGRRDYSEYLDRLGQFNTDRSFAYGAARDNQQLGRQAVEDQYGRYRDQIADQRWDAQWAQQLREYADAQNWKATEWQQYLREYGDKMSQQEREWAYQMMRDSISDARYEDETGYQRSIKEWDMQQQQAQLAAKYGDYSGLGGLGIDTSKADPKEVAYAQDGSTYKFNTDDARYFTQNAPNGTPGQPTTMRGGDGSIWRKDEYGGVTIEKNGKVYTYRASGGVPAQQYSEADIERAWKLIGDSKANPTTAAWAQQVLADTYGMQFGGGAPAQTGSGYSYTGSGGGNEEPPTSDNDALSQMAALGIQSRAQAYSWLLANGYDKSSASFAAAEKLADYYAEMLGEDPGTPKYDETTLNRAWQNVDSSNSALKAWARDVLTDAFGMDFGGDGEQASPVEQGAGYRNIDGTLGQMVSRGASRNEIYAEIDAEVRDGSITKEQGEALKEKYYDLADNLANSGTHANGMPRSSRYTGTKTGVKQVLDRDGVEAALLALQRAEDLIHDYEIGYIMDELGLGLE